MSRVWISALTVVAVSTDSGGEIEQLQAGILADTREEAAQLLQKKLISMGQHPKQVKTILTFEQWAHDFPHEWDAMGLARRVTPSDPVAVLIARDRFSPVAAPADWLEIDRSRQIQPLGRQHGVFPRLNVPPSIADQLFDGATHTYVIIDGALIPLLPERLETSGLQHSCLYRGARSGASADSAPWLVRLEKDSDFTRHLFTVSGRDTDLVVRDAALFVISREPFAAVLSHLRYFTRLRDNNDQWFLFRFWSGAHLFALLEATKHNRLHEFSRFFRSRHAMLDALGYFSDDGTWRFARRVGEVPASTSTLRVSAPFRDALQAARKGTFIQRLKDHLLAQDIRRDLSDQEIEELIKEAKRDGMTIERAVADYVEGRLRLGQPISMLKEGSVSDLRKLHQLDHARLLLKLVKDHK